VAVVDDDADADGGDAGGALTGGANVYAPMYRK
jgi:hypothetical protein